MADVTTTTLTADAPSTWNRYTRVAVILHWLIGLMILGLLASGLWMVDAIKVEEQQVFAYDVYQLHKSLGITVLGLTVLRLLWRILNPAPPLPDGMSGFERAGAHFSHFGFYFLMLALPLSGWAMVSASPQALPTSYFFWAEIPHLPVLSTLEKEAKPAVEATLQQSHMWAAYAMIALLALHVGAALKHHFVNRDAVLARMAPWISPRGPVFEPQSDRTGVGAAQVFAAMLVLAVAGGGVAAVAVFEDRGAAPVSAAAVATTDADIEMSAGATLWGPVLAESAITFTGDNAGEAFSGGFSDWKALIAFDPDNLEESEVVVIIETASATVSSDTVSGVMLGEDGLDPAAHPKATFTSTDFVDDPETGGFIARGLLAIRGVEKPVELPFSLAIEGDRAEMTASILIDRIAYEIGLGNDATGAFVSAKIPVEIKVVALRSDG